MDLKGVHLAYSFHDVCELTRSFLPQTEQFLVDELIPETIPEFDHLIQDYILGLYTEDYVEELDPRYLPGGFTQICQACHGQFTEEYIVVRGSLSLERTADCNCEN